MRTAVLAGLLALGGGPIPLPAVPGAYGAPGGAAPLAASPVPDGYFELGADGTSPLVAVGIAHHAPELIVRPHGDFSIIDQRTGEIKRLDRGRDYKVEADSQGNVIFGPFLFFGATRLLPGRAGEHVTIGKRRYRGNIVFQPNEDETVTAVDELDIEEYLCGVLPKEMSPDWPLEALKAQAVVARTFALNNLGKYSESGYDLSDDARSQIYTGITDISPRVKRAVGATSGQVLAWRGKRLPVYFHSSCGGHTTDPASVWEGTGANPRPLRGVSDRYCRDSPHREWSAYFRRADILRMLQRRGRNAATLRAVRTGRRDGNGYLKDLRLKMDGRWVRVPANEFRLWIGPSHLKSTNIRKISRKRKGFQFFGRGYGHGVGLCQWGARTQAEQGWSYRRILRFYFPGADISGEAAL